ncbi:hypothetical protein [Streptomyces sp. ISL-100]|uniref:hypothetical protein n=1 Tax=Streptomyces sp. ISL-100 TaxID=2819173 RepID=UPI001BEC6321|nr:hypothetical protein [Streptomyces sp. ISL-100]MBT2394830.1 hypothetical protein [Streptomyces sp. ISL-100]
MRSVGLTAVSLWAISAILALPLLDPNLTGAGMHVLVGAVGTILAALLCEASVVLFNFPKIVVPPHMRADRGVLAALRERPERRTC